MSEPRGIREWVEDIQTCVKRIHDEAMAIGKGIGYAEAKFSVTRQNILLVVEARFPLTDVIQRHLAQRLRTVTDEYQLADLLETAACCTSVEEFQTVQA